jgi:hypothetical protein
MAKEKKTSEGKETNGESKMTYATRLPMCGQKLQFLTVTELHKNVDGPFLVVLVFIYSDLPSTADI